MTETQLQNLLQRAAFRLRVDRALRWSLAAGSISLVIAALTVFIMRWNSVTTLPLIAFAALPPTLALLSGILAFILIRPATPAVAALLDRRARTQEHLATWLHLRQQSTPTDIQESFKSAQKNATLEAAESVQLKRDVPVKFPSWSRALWLALILFISAILTPPADPRTARTVDRSAGQYAADPASDALESRAANDPLINAVREIPRVQVLSPAQMRKLELIATDPRLPPEMQAAALKELQSAIGSVSDNELPPDVRQLLETLRELTGQKDRHKPAGNQPAVSANTEKPSPAAIEPAAEFKAFQDVEKGWSRSEPRFSDVKDALRKYYQESKPGQGQP